MKKLPVLLFAVLALSCSEPAVNIPEPVCPEGGFVATNPLTYTDIPDNDVIRVGDDYYMVSTTMYFCPGAPIMHSRDLVHWRIVSYIYDLLEDDDVYSLRGGRDAYGAGQWATSLRYHDGVYYALFVANDQKKSYLYRTGDLVNGPWERTVFEDYFFHDPSLLFDDGRLWVVYGNGDLKLAELSPDGSRVISEPRVVLNAPRRGMGLRAEGAHFYKIGEYYYIIEIDWPKRGIRQVTCWRSKSVDGSYESKVVLRGTLDGRSRDGIAQGPIVDTPAGDWYAIQFQDHGAVGRIPTLQPVSWEDGWPVMGYKGVPMQKVAVTLPEDTAGDYVWSSDDFSSDKLALVWQWNHRDPGDWSLTERPGWLRLRSHGQDTLSRALGTLTQRTVGPRCISEVLIDPSGLQPGSEAGICAFQSNSARIGVSVSQDGSRHIVIREGEKEVYRQPLDSPLVRLLIKYVFTPVEDGDQTDTARFFWSECSSADEAGGAWKTDPSYSLQMTYTLDYFTGYRTGLYCLGSTGYADFDYFHQQVY